MRRGRPKHVRPESFSFNDPGGSMRKDTHCKASAPLQGESDQDYEPRDACPVLCDEGTDQDHWRVQRGRVGRAARAGPLGLPNQADRQCRRLQALIVGLSVLACDQRWAWQFQILDQGCGRLVNVATDQVAVARQALAGHAENAVAPSPSSDARGRGESLPSLQLIRVARSERKWGISGWGNDAAFTWIMSR
jgi:hypothetical protein